MKRSLGAKTILEPTPVLLIGTYDDQGRPNIMTCAWGGLCCSDPPCVAVSLREPRHTYTSIVRSKAFTVGVPSASLIKAADYAGIHSGKDTDKFSALGLTPVHAEHVDAPYADECPLVLECELTHTIPLGVHVQFVGEILDVKADESILNAQGQVDVTALKPICFDPAGGGYYGLGEFLGQAFSVGKEV